MRLPYLDPIRPDRRKEAAAALAAGNWLGCFILAPNEHALDLVFFNHAVLLERGVYEAALLDALTITRTNHHYRSLSDIATLFHLADRSRLRAAGAPLPGPGPFTVFRGVAGSGRARHPRGFSWTLDVDRARWFAGRSAIWGLRQPAVWSGIVGAADVLAYVDDRQEREIIAFPETVKRPREIERLRELNAEERRAAFYGET